MAYLLALASAALFGAADFLGGLAARHTHASVVVVLSGAAGVALLAVLLVLLPGQPAAPDLAWGAAAGLAGGIAIGLLYRALAVGRMSIVAPTTAVCGVAIPVLVGVALGERPSATTVVGMALALVAIVLVSQQPADVAPADAAAVASNTGDGDATARAHVPQRGPARAAGVDIALLAGVAIGLFYLALAETSPAAGLWPLLAARATSVSLFTVVALAGRRSFCLQPPVLRLVLGAGLLDMAANALYLLATRGGPLSVVVTLSSLYPASTVLLAGIVLHERLNAWQLAGVVCALAAVALIVGGA